MLDTKENYYALMVSICSRANADQAFMYLDGKKSYLTEEDTLEMVEMKAKGLTYKKIAEIFNVSCATVRNRIRRFRERELTK